MRNVEADFSRSQTTKRITNVVLLVGVLASLLVAFPMMIGLNSALADGRPLFFFVPFAVALALRSVIRLVRR